MGSLQKIFRKTLHSVRLGGRPDADFVNRPLTPVGQIGWMILTLFALAVCAAAALIVGLGAVVTGEPALGHDAPRGSDFI